MSTEMATGAVLTTEYIHKQPDVCQKQNGKINCATGTEWNSTAQCKKLSQHATPQMILKNNGEWKKPATESPVRFILQKGQKKAKLNNISYRIHPQVI